MTSSATSELELSASVLSLDLATLGAQVTALDCAGIDAFHLDIMDGHFVPNLTFGPAMVKALRPYTTKPLSTHLMVTDADLWLEELAEAGANRVSVHVESRVHLHRTLLKIKSLGMDAGVAINPGTSLAMLDAVQSVIDFVLVMSVDPGFGGQDLVSGAFERSRSLRARLGSQSKVALAMDGGLKESNLGFAAQAGVARAVVGSGLLDYPSFDDGIEKLKAAFFGKSAADEKPKVQNPRTWGKGSAMPLALTIGNDHAGFELKTTLLAHLREHGHEVKDVGSFDARPADYPDYAEKVALSVLEGGRRGILICGSGIGAAMAANKLPGIRAGLAHDTYSAHQGVEHDDMNILVLGSRVIGVELAKELLEAFLAAHFSGEERRLRRLAKVAALESVYCLKGQHEPHPL